LKLNLGPNLEKNQKNAQLEIVGNSASAALIDETAGVTRLSLPFLDSPSLFSFNTPFRIHPAQDFRSQLSRLEDTFVVQTDFETAHGKGRVTDWMPEDGEPVLYRKVETLEGKIDWQLRMQIRSDWPTRLNRWRNGFLIQRMDQNLRDSGNSDHFLQFSSPLEGFEEIQLAANHLTLGFTLQDTQSLVLSFSHGRWVPHLEHCPASLRKTIAAWKAKAHRCEMKNGKTCVFAGPWHGRVADSILLLQLLRQPFSGSFAQAIDAPRVSTLPCKESPFLFQALVNCAPTSQMAEHFVEFIAYLFERDAPRSLDCSYGLDGSHLNRTDPSASYLDSAYFILALSEFSRIYHRLPSRLWPKLSLIADELCQKWKRPDTLSTQDNSGANPREKHYTGPKILIWTALDRMEGFARTLGETVPLHWRREKNILAKVIQDQGLSTGILLNAFEDSEAGPSSLLAPYFQFLRNGDPRLRATIDEIKPDTLGSLSDQLLAVGSLALSGATEESADALRQFCDQHPESWLSENGEYPSMAAHIHFLNATLYVGMANGRTLPHRYLLGMPERVVTSGDQALTHRFRRKPR
jgi:hypothetical protein